MDLGFFLFGNPPIVIGIMIAYRAIDQKKNDEELSKSFTFEITFVLAGFMICTDCIYPFLHYCSKNMRLYFQKKQGFLTFICSAGSYYVYTKKNATFKKNSNI